MQDPETRAAAREWRRKWIEKNPDYQREWYQANREKLLARQKARRCRIEYKITVEEYDEIIARGCAICGTHEGKMCMDHCHASGNIRDALCMSCNSALGMMKDDPRLLRVAADYLEKHAAGVEASMNLDAIRVAEGRARQQAQRKRAERATG